MLLFFFFFFSLFCSRIVGQNNSIFIGDPPPDGAPFTAIHFASHGDYGCQERDDIINRLQKLDAYINSASILATSAANALRIPGVERSPAFLRWFGAGNADKVQDIRVNNYLAAKNWLNFPTTHIDFYAQEIRENGPFTTYDILPSDLVYVCGLRDRKPCEIDVDGGSVLAVTFSQTPTDTVTVYGATVLFLCPIFFELATFEAMGEDWNKNPQIIEADGGATLLHEAQHMIQLTGPARMAIDITSGNCYTIEDCEAYADDLKIKNAQNFLFFALDAQFKPQEVLPPAPTLGSNAVDA